MVAGGRKSHAAVSGSEDTLRSHISNFDNEWCVNMRNDIHLSHMCPSVLLADRVRETRCPLGQFPCGNMTECLPQVLQCNGHKDCPNGADERGCGESMHPDTEDTARFSAVLPGKARFSHVQIVTALKVMRWNQVLCILGIFFLFFGELLHIWKMCGAAHSSVHAHTNTHEQIRIYACTHTHTLIYLLTGGARQLVLFFLEWSEEKIWQWINVFCLRNNAGFYSSWRLFVCLLAKSKSCFIWMQLWVFPFMCYNLLLGP